MTGTTIVGAGLVLAGLALMVWLEWHRRDGP